MHTKWCYEYDVWVGGSERRANKRGGGRGGKGRERRREKKKLKIGNPHLGMVAKEADGIV